MARSVTLRLGPTFPILRAAETHFAWMLDDEDRVSPSPGTSLAESARSRRPSCQYRWASDRIPLPSAPSMRAAPATPRNASA